MMTIDELYHKEIAKDTKRTSKAKPFINNQNWRGTDYPSGKDDWKMFDKNNPICFMLKNEYISYLYFKTQLKS